MAEFIYFLCGRDFYIYYTGQNMHIYERRGPLLTDANDNSKVINLLLIVPGRIFL
jgi:hypothetical protein